MFHLFAEAEGSDPSPGLAAIVFSRGPDIRGLCEKRERSHYTTSDCKSQFQREHLDFYRSTKFL